MTGPHVQDPANACRSCCRPEQASSEMGVDETTAARLMKGKGRVQALYVANGPLVIAHRTRINTLALGSRLPTMHGGREHVETGGLMSYAPSFPDLYKQVEFGFLAGITPFGVGQPLGDVKDERGRSHVAQVLE